MISARKDTKDTWVGPENSLFSISGFQQTPAKPFSDRDNFKAPGREEETRVAGVADQILDWKPRELNRVSPECAGMLCPGNAAGASTVR
jgi:hypothetical protein